MPQSLGEQISVSKDVSEDRSDAVHQVFVSQPGEEQTPRAPATKGNHLNNLKEMFPVKRFLQPNTSY